MITKMTLSWRALAGIKLLAVFIVLLMLACSLAIAAAAEIRVGGAAEACNGMFTVIKEQIRDETRTNLLVTPNSSAQALLDLDRGNIDIAATDVPLDSLITDLEKMGYLIAQESFQTQGIGTNTILVYLHKSNQVAALSQGQLRDIFSGKVSNWQQLGGDNQKIVVFWGKETPDQNRLFSRFVIGSRPIVKTAIRATDQQDIIERISKTPGTIGIASHVHASGRTRNPKTPFVSAKVIAITKGAPSGDMQRLLEVMKSYDF